MRQRKPRRVQVQLGGQKITKVGANGRNWRDAYHVVLSMNWASFFFGLLCSYAILNLFFAFLYGLEEGAIGNATRGFVDRLFFSIETLSTVGYGNMYPSTVYAHIVAAAEIFTGLVGVALVTGIMFARFSRPRARILFSNSAVITKFNGVPTLMVRVANERHNLILEADVTMTLVRAETTSEGSVFRRQYDLALARSHSGAFALSWTIMHPITKDSPLHGYTAEKLESESLFIAVSIRGLDDILEQNVHARDVYQVNQIRFNEHFADVLIQVDDESILDLTKFNDTIPD